MSSHHSNPTKKRAYTYNNDLRNVEARAPYNFVPLPDDVVQAREPLHLNTYLGGNSGRIHCKMTTFSPTYVRGMMDQALYNDLLEKNPLTVEDKERLAPFFHKGQENDPCIPGSSLRGMLRSLVEIITYSRIRWVSKDFAYYFRAVAVPGDDPLGEPYNKALSNVRGGFIRKSDHDWIIEAAPLPENIDPSFNYKTYFTLENSSFASQFDRFSNFQNKDFTKNLLKHTYKVSFSVDSTEKYNQVSAVSKYNEGGNNLEYVGYVIPSDNMLFKTSKNSSRRHRHAVILDPQVWANRPKDEPEPLQPARYDINTQAVKDYLANLTDFIKDNIGTNGVLVEGRPVFFIPPADENGKVLDQGEVINFGHSPNFRVGARGESMHLAHLEDFIPPSARGTEKPDMTDIIFGWTEEQLLDGSWLGPRGQRKGRIAVSDARLVGTPNKEQLWHNPPKAPPKILSSPKPSTFQHYLVQDREKGHDPDKKGTLAHYGTDPLETQLRGYKLYWNKGRNPDFIENSDVVRSAEKQYTRINALNPGISFEFDVRFEQLRDEELGALLWALKIPTEEGKTYCHRIGMGKPYGMGAIHFEQVDLFLIDRQKRYQALLNEEKDKWADFETKEETIKVAALIEEFEKFILARIDGKIPRLNGLYRIQQLLTMLEWRGDSQTKDWKDQTEYMPLIDFKHRPVLPDPRGVATKASSLASTNAQAPLTNNGPVTPSHAPRSSSGQRMPQKNQSFTAKVTAIEEQLVGAYKTIKLSVPDYESIPGIRFIMKMKNSDPMFPVLNATIEVLVSSINAESGDTIVICHPKKE